MKQHRALLIGLLLVAATIGFLSSNLWSRNVTEAEARKLAAREFFRMCDVLKIAPSDFMGPRIAHIRGVRYSFIWYHRRGERPILVSVAADGWAEPSLGVERSPMPQDSTKDERPNQALEPTTTAVTDRAGARSAPAAVVAHL